MWEYKKIEYTIVNPKQSPNILIENMNRLGENGWDIFSLQEKIVDEWTAYSEKQIEVVYTLYMKRKKEI